MTEHRRRRRPRGDRRLRRDRHGVEDRAALGDDQQAMVLYDLTTGPFGILRVTEHLAVRDGRIASSTLVFDSHPVREAMANSSSDR
jgi:hypothetical protein